MRLDSPEAIEKWLQYCREWSPPYKPEHLVFGKKRHERYLVMPPELTDHQNWVGWGGRGGQKKIPMQFGYYNPASATDPTTWTTFWLARKQFAGGGRTTGWRGLGYVFRPEFGIVGIDIDGAWIPEEQCWDPRALDLVELFGCPTEVSQSGRGLHIFILAKISKEMNGTHILENGLRIELYDRDRYFAMTGEFWECAGASYDLDEDHTETIRALLATATKRSYSKKGAAAGDGADDGSVEYVSLADGAVAGKGERNNSLFHFAFRALWTEDDKRVAIEEIERANQEQCDPPLSADEVRSVIRSAMKYRNVRDERTRERERTKAEKQRDKEDYQVAKYGELSQNDGDVEALTDQFRTAGHVCGCLRPARDCTAVTRWVAEGERIRGQLMVCRDWSCDRCGPYRKAMYFLFLLLKFGDYERAYKTTIPRWMWKGREFDSARRSLVRKGGHYIAIPSGGEKMSVFSTHSLSKKTGDIISEVLPRDVIGDSLFDSFAAIRPRDRSGERLVSSSRGWSFEDARRHHEGEKKKQEDEMNLNCVLLGFGPRPDRAREILEDEGIHIEVDEPFAVGGGDVIHQSATIRCDSVFQVEEIADILKIRPPKHGDYAPRDDAEYERRERDAIRWDGRSQAEDDFSD